MIPKIEFTEREIAAEKEVIKLISEQQNQLDFYDVVNMIPKRSSVFKGEAKLALVGMINNGTLIENPNRTIRFPKPNEYKIDALENARKKWKLALYNARSAWKELKDAENALNAHPN